VTKGASKILPLWLTGQVEQRCQSTSPTQELLKFQQNQNKFELFLVAEKKFK
jgi:hypothetical protein